MRILETANLKPKDGLSRKVLYFILMNTPYRIFLLVTLIAGIGVTGFPQQKTRIRFEGAQSMKNLNLNGQKIIRYIGNVRFQHENTRIVCDSAYHNPEDNWFNAFGKVRINQGKTTITGETLYFDGKTSSGKITGREVTLVDEDATLVTQTLFFNSKTNRAYYTSPGVITTSDSKLTSQRGYYNRNSNQFSFAGSVVMTNPDVTIYTDSLTYNTQNELSSFFGPTHIFNKDNFAYCEKGWYNKKIDQTNLQQNAYILNKNNKIFGDNIFYDRAKKYARIIGNAVMIDTVNRAYIYGQKANFWQDTEQAEVTDNPYLMQINNNDSLFLKANRFTLVTNKNPDNKKNATDSTYRILRALGNVMFYRSDVQGTCDSLIYNTRDSVIDMYVNPILWNESNQITADKISILTSENKLKRMNFDGNAFITSFEENSYYNQIKGKNIIAHFIDGKVNKIDINGNGQAIYFIRDGNLLTMANRSESAKISILVKGNKVSRITFREKPISNLYPIEKAEQEDITLKGFKWLGDKRPMDKYAIVPMNFRAQPEEKGEALRKREMQNILKSYEKER